MDEFGNFSLTSPPPSLPDGLISAQGTVPPIPRPRRGSASSFTSSTPKQHLSPYGPLSRNNQFNSSISPFGRSKNNKINRTPSNDSSGSCEIRIAPFANMLDNSDNDSEEEENMNHQGNSSERLNGNGSRSKRSLPRYVSRSLPVTPRVNGNTQNALNGGVSSSFIGGSSNPLLLAPHLSSHYPLEGSINSISSLSQGVSQYVTCSSGIMSESQEKVLSGTIDYSSLPLPKEETVRPSSKRLISRHLSEPSIHEIPAGHLSVAGKCHSCPQRRVTSKHKRKEAPLHSLDKEPLGNKNFLRSSFCGIDAKSDEEMPWKIIKTLIDELNKCRCHNNRMAVELHQSKMEVQMLKCALDAYSEAGVQPGVISEMVGQIHAAQKIRDEAMMSRIKLANEERDAALTQTHALLEKLGLSPRTPLDHFNFNVFTPQQNNSGISSKGNEEGINLSAIEEELNALRLAIRIQDTVQERSCPHEVSNLKGKDVGAESREFLDELKAKLSDSEASRLQLQDRCWKLEHIFSCLRRKVNGLSAIDGTSLNPSSLTFLDMSIFETPETNRSHHNDFDASPQPSMPANGSPRMPKRIPNDKGRRGGNADDVVDVDSLSSIDSAETSATSWKHLCPNHNHLQGLDTNSHSPLTLTSPPPPASSSSSSHSSFSSQSSDKGTSEPAGCFGGKNFPTRDDSVKSHHHHHHLKDQASSERNAAPLSKNDFKPRNSGEVTLMGPITEL